MKAKQIRDLILEKESKFEKLKSELTQVNNNIGFHEPTQKWYGWSHRAYYGFGVGDKVEKGDSGYTSNNKKDFEDETIEFHMYPKNHYKDIKITNRTKDSFDLEFTYTDKVPNKDLRGKTETIHTKYKLGKGEWTAKDLDDAKEMATDFAKSVS